MKTGLPAIIVSRDPSVWGSCRVITPNIEMTYQKLFGNDANYFNYAPEMPPMDIWRLAKDILRSKPERLVFIDHAPHPELLLVAMNDLMSGLSSRGAALPPVYVHVYGDFTLYVPNWVRTEAVLKKTRVELICASDRQRRLVSNMVKEPEGVSKCPFPLDPKVYYFDPVLRAKVRAELGIADDEHLMLYTGRLSMQKSILRLTTEFRKLRRNLSFKTKLLLAGNFDDLAAPLFGCFSPKGYYYLSWRETLNQGSPEQASAIQYLGNFGPDRLVGLYNAADTYISLSLHHDEDYGMSPAEALFCGARTILTDWGGYASFADGTAACRLVPVSIAKQGLSISVQALRVAMFHQVMSQRTDEERLEQSRRYQARLSVDAAVDILSKLHARRPAAFRGFTKTAYTLAQRFQSRVPFPTGPERGGFYEEIYAAYINQKT